MKGQNVLIATLMLLCTLGLGFWVDQSSFDRIALCFIPFFCLYALVISRKEVSNISFWLGVALLLRLVLLFAFPKLSDDIFRFVWDGRLWLAGYNPFDHLPTWYIEQGLGIKGITPTLFEQLNSPEYYTIYPPLAQFIFTIACWISPNSIWGTALVMKIFLLLADIGSIALIIRLLKHWNLPTQRVLWYALNPLLIVETIGNLHFEGIMIFFVLLALWLLVKSKWVWSAAAMAMAVVAKLLPLMFLPFLIKRLGWKKSFKYFAILGLVLMACWLPLLNTHFIENFGSSLDLYYRKFEFNASLHYLVRWFGRLLFGYNMIAYTGPAMALMVLLTILYRSYKELGENWVNLPELWLFAISLYLIFATTVHPWYAALPVVLCLFTNWRWPLVWSGLIWLTYINYSYAEYVENLWIVGFEYTIVFGYMIWEIKQRGLNASIEKTTFTNGE